MKRLLIIGLESVSFQVMGIVTACERMGVYVEHIPFRKLIREDGLSDTLNVVNDTLKTDRFDVVLFFNLQKIITLDVIKKIKSMSHGEKFVFWCMDDPISDDGKDWICEIDEYLSVCKRTATKHHGFWVPVPYDSFYHYPRKVDKVKSVGFVATAVYKFSNHINRYDLIKQCMSEFGSQFGLWGWGKQIESYPCYQGSVLWPRFSDFVGSVTVSLNPSGASGYLYWSDRVIYTLASGGALVMEKTPGVDSVFEDGVHLMFAGSMEEMVEQASWLVKHPEIAEMIGRIGRSKVAGWTFERFVDCLMGSGFNGVTIMGQSC